MSLEQPAAPFVYPFNVRKLARAGQAITFSADAETCRAIASAYDLIAVESFDVGCKLRPWKRDGVELVGQVVAKIVQPCAVSAEPLEQLVDEELEAIFLPEGSKLLRPLELTDQELIIDPMGADVPDTFTGDSIDLAEPWLEAFVLGIDPFARLEGAEFEVDNASDESDSPFSALAKLKLDEKPS